MLGDMGEQLDSAGDIIRSADILIGVDISNGNDGNCMDCADGTEDMLCCEDRIGGYSGVVNGVGISAAYIAMSIEN